VVVVAAVATIAALGGGGEHPEPSTIATVNVSRLRPGDVLVTDHFVSLPNQASPAPVFVADTPENVLVALIGRSTHLGCRVQWVHARGYHRFETHPEVAFEDPCGGSLFALNGDCVGGPCPRGLYRLRSTSTGAELRIDLGEIIDGKPRSPDAQLSS
jgi:Rieske Fe-S protein